MNSPESAAGFSPKGQNLPPLETVELTSGPNPTVSVIWLHGLGADGHDFEPLVPHLSWPGAPDIRFIFPHAPVRPVTVNGGMPMRAWYDILSMDAERGHDRGGIEQSIRQVRSLLEQEQERGIHASRIILAGFSQGGAIALLLGLKYPHRLAGLIALSTYLLYGDTLREQVPEENSDLPLFMAHGSFDPIVPLALGDAARKQLDALGFPLEWHTYPMPHSVCPEEVADITAWLGNRLD